MRRDSFTPHNVKLIELNLDVENPRIGHKPDEKACVESILASKNFINLVKDIAENGIGLSPIVAYQKNDVLTVMDGNRRITALKLLSNPVLAKGHAHYQKIVDYAKQARESKTLDDTINIYVSDNLSQVYQHMRLTHTGENNGVGQRDWTAMSQAVFAIDQGIPDDNLLAAKIVLFFADTERFSFSEDYPVTILTRLMKQDTLKKKFGLDLENGNIKWEQKTEAAKNAIIRILSAIRDGDIVTNDVRTPEQQKKYIADILNDYQVQPTNYPQSPGDKDNQADNEDGKNNSSQEPSKGKNDSTEKGNPKQTSPTKPAWDRKTVVNGRTHRFHFDGKPEKFKNVYSELKKLKLDGASGTPIAATFLVRAFTEMSVEYYRKKYKTGYKTDGAEKPGLASAAKAVAENLLSQGKITADLKKRIFQMASQDQFLSFSSLQKYLHSEHFHPTKQSVNTLWDELYDFLKVCLNN